MFNVFKADRQPDVKSIRSGLLQLIKEQLQKAEGGEGGNIRGLLLYLTCSPARKHLYESAVYFDEAGRFKNEEVQKIADDYAIALPENWTMELIFDVPPPEAIPAKNVDAALFIATRSKSFVQKDAVAYLRVLNGEAEKDQYTLRSILGKINIGRERKVQAADGFYRENVIAFSEASHHPGNKSVSRQHAHIEWNGASNAFCLYADEGGIPPLNKTKVRNTAGEILKIQTSEIAHHLHEGDQIMLGESAVLEFTYRGDQND